MVSSINHQSIGLQGSKKAIKLLMFVLAAINAGARVGDGMSPDGLDVTHFAEFRL